jgi:hypothetical protein
MSACAYRSLEPVLEQRLVELCEKRAREAFPLLVTHRVAARRVGRAFGGAVMLAFGVVALACGLASLLADGASQKETRILATEVLLAGWAAGLVVALAAAYLERFVLAARSNPPLLLSGNAAVDLVGLEARDPLAVAKAHARRWERASVALPLAALSISSPLTIHWLVWTTLQLASRGTVPADDFGEWIGYSALIVGHAHIAVLVGSVLWARSLRSKPTALVRQDLCKHWGLTLLVAVGVACVPGIALLGIPPILVAITGLAFIPAMYLATAYVVQQERLTLEAT